MIIDFHTHIFPDRIAPATIRALSATGGIPAHTDGTAEGLAASMKKAGISLSVNLPVLTQPHQSTRVNERLIESLEETKAKGILPFGGIHPDYENCRDILRMLKDAGIPGIKLHPAYQETDLDDERYLRIIDEASELGLIVLTHAGPDIGIPGHNYASVEMILHVIERVRPPRFVLAHMGGWNDWETVKKYLAGAPVWLDTAFSPDEGFLSDDRFLPDEDFISLCRAHGTDRILFATDSPWSDQSAYVQAVRRMPFTETEREAIFGGNAMKLLEIDPSSCHTLRV